MRAEAEERGEDVERNKNWEWTIEENEEWEKKKRRKRGSPVGPLCALTG